MLCDDRAFMDSIKEGLSAFGCCRDDCYVTYDIASSNSEVRRVRNSTFD
jgi:hypothetical protein